MQVRTAGTKDCAKIRIFLLFFCKFLALTFSWNLLKRRSPNSSRARRLEPNRKAIVRDRTDSLRVRRFFPAPTIRQAHSCPTRSRPRVRQETLPLPPSFPYCRGAQPECRVCRLETA